VPFLNYCVVGQVGLHFLCFCLGYAYIELSIEFGGQFSSIFHAEVLSLLLRQFVSYLGLLQLLLHFFFVFLLLVGLIGFHSDSLRVLL